MFEQNKCLFCVIWSMSERMFAISGLGEPFVKALSKGNKLKMQRKGDVGHLICPRLL